MGSQFLLSTEERIRVTIMFMSLSRVGPITARALLARTKIFPESLDDLASYLSGLDAKPRGFTGVTADALKAALDKADDCIETCRVSGIGIAVDQEAPFESAVWSIPKAPAVLYYKGEVAAAGQLGVAVVGTREPTDFGYKSAERIASRCCERGFTVVSGLAVGCDTSAHEGALAVGGKTIAVLAHGLDTVYPGVNRKLAERILEGGGLLVSEYPIGTEIRSNQFVERDRLQAGLSRAVVVIETDIEGGTMHTVDFAVSQGRMLGALAHPDRWLQERKTQGNQELIRTGKANPLSDNETLIEFLDSLRSFTPVGAGTTAKPQSLF
jgi:DNA processing protein